MAKAKIGFFYGDKRNTGQYDNGVWMDILQVPFLERIDDARDFDIIIRTLWLESVGWSKAIRDKFPHIIQIGLSDHPLSTHISKMPPQQQIAYIQDLDYVDGIMALTEEERQWYQTAVPSKPVIKAGLPFPFESYEKNYADLKGKERRFIGLGVGAADNDRNFITSLIVFKRLKLEYPDIQGLFLSIPSNLLNKVVPLADASEDVFIHEREDMASFYDVLAECKFVINMADRNTPGRIQGEAAFFDVPVIGSNRLELQNELFPTLSVSPYSAEDALQAARTLLDVADHTKLTEYAQKKLRAYTYAKSKKKFFKLLKEIEAKS